MAEFEIEGPHFPEALGGNISKLSSFIFLCHAPRQNPNQRYDRMFVIKTDLTD